MMDRIIFLGTGIDVIANIVQVFIQKALMLKRYSDLFEFSGSVYAGLGI
jgi:hypothetical protein